MTPTRTCRTCGTPLLANDQFCASCGTPVNACRSCGELLLPADRFCPKCGAGASQPGGGRSSGGVVSPWAQVRERLAAATSGEFELIRELGRGGMAAVYLAGERALNRQVAIKVMSPGLMLGEGMVERFRQEAVTVANLNHPNIVTIHAVRQLDELHYFVMQFVEGPSLDQVLATEGPLAEPLVRAIVAQAGSALAYAHRRGVIHRDIKPANILLDGDGNAIVMDFGIAKVAETPGQTKTGTMVGTPAYMSPEQCAGEPLTWSSDLYSLGIVAYELLTGVPPFLGSNFVVMKGHLEAAPAPVRAAAPECSEEFAGCVARMIAKLPTERFETMGAMLRAVGTAALMEDGPVRAELRALAGGAEPGARLPTPIPTPPPYQPPTTVPRSPRTITIHHLAVEGVPERVEMGDQFNLAAAVRSRSGNAVPGVAVSWTSSDENVIAIEADGGRAQAVGEGKAELTARGGSAHATISVRVLRPAPISLEVPIERRSVISGEQCTLSAVLLDRHGRPVDEPISWATSDPSIATISSRGVLLARAPGDVRVTASAGALESTVALSVSAEPVAAPKLAAIPDAVMAAQPAVTTVAAVAAVTPTHAPARRRLMLPGVAGVAAATALVVFLLTRSGSAPREATAPASAGSALPAPVTVNAPPADSSIREVSAPERPTTPRTSPPAVPAADAAAKPDVRKSQKASDTPGPRADATARPAVTPDHAELPPPSPPAPDPIQLATTAIRSAGERCMAAMRANDADRMATLYQPASDGDKQNADKLVTLMRRSEWALATTVAPVTLTPTVEGTQAHADFPARMAWKTSFGGKRELDVLFRVTIRQTGGAWGPAGCRLVGNPDL